MKKVITLLALICVAAMLLAGCQNTPAPAEHTHTLIHNEAKAPTCVNNGILEHWYCPGCNARYTDAGATEEVTFADLEVEEQGHIAGEDDGDCTTAVDCIVCGEVATAAKAHTPAEDDGDCTTAVDCTECDQIAVEAKEAHEAAEDDGDCTTAVTCKYCDHIFVAAAEDHTPGAAATCTTAQICTVCEKELDPAKGHTGYEADYKCDACSTMMFPEDGTALTIPQALAIAKAAGSAYTTQKYYITGTVTGLYNATYGNFYIEDADGNQICIYGLYTWDKAIRYDKMDYKPVNGDEVTVYTVLGTYNSAAQGKDAWLDEVVAHEHDYKAVVTAPGCLTEGYTTHTCLICEVSYVDAKVAATGHTTEEGVCDNCGQTIGGDAPVVGTLAEFTFGSNGTATHADGNDIGTAKSYTVGAYTLSLQNAYKVYDGARDAKGNSCLKLGTGSVAGKFEFTVDDNVTEVVIYVAKYKTNAATVKVNGTATTLTKASADGEYDVITIDTTTNKTVTFEVSSGNRCMVNTIVFNGTAQ